MKIRKATLNDLEEIKQLNQKLFYYDFNFDKTLDTKWPDKNKNYYKKRITDENSIALVAENEEKIIGYLFGVIANPKSYRKIKKIAELENMFVLENYRGKGVRIALVKEFFGWAKNNKVGRIKVIAYAQNEKVIQFYKKNLFSEYSVTLEADI